MGNKNDYLTFDEAARMLGRSVAFLKGILSEGKLSAKLAGGRWLISVRDVEGLRQTLSLGPDKVVGNFDGDGPQESPRVSKPISDSKPGVKPRSTGNAVSKGKHLRKLDARVQDLADEIEVELAYVRERKIVWDKLRADNFTLNVALRAQLPNGLVRPLDDLRKTKQEYILLRETDRFKRLLRLLPEYNYQRVARIVGTWPKFVEAQQQEQSTAPPKPKLVRGIDGYFDGRVAEKHYWDRGDAPPMPAAQEARLMLLRSKGRAAARSMRDRGKSREAREAAETTWAQTRREAERVMRGGLQGAWEPSSVSESKRTEDMGSPTSSKNKKKASHPTPRRDPASGIMLVVEQPVNPRVFDALKRCLRAVGLPGAYVTNTSVGVLNDELLAAQPHALVAIGAGAARYIDATDYPLVRQPFLEAEPGVWFSWTTGISGLLLPSLAPALDDEAAKHRFRRAFLTLKALASTP